MTLTDGATRLILGTVVSNGGDAAILHAQLDLLKRGLGDASTLIQDSNPTLAKKIFPSVGVVSPGWLADAAIRLRDLLMDVNVPVLRQVTGRLAYHLLPALSRRATNTAVDRVLKTGPLVFYTGGTSLIEKYDLDDKFRHMRRAIELGRSLVLLPQSVGPFQEPANLEAVKHIVAGAALVLLRDERSRGHLSDIGADLSQVHVVPDVVFCLATQADVDRLAQAQIPARGPTIAVGIRDCRKFFDNGDPDTRQDDLERSYAELVTEMVRERAARITFVSTCQGIAGYWTDDSRVSLSVYSRLPDDVRANCVVDREFHDTDGLRSILKDCDLVIANRLHGAILALTVGVPVIPVEYEFKTREVFCQLGQGGAVYSINEPESLSLSEHVDGFIENWETGRVAAAESLGRLVSLAWDTGKMIQSSLFGETTVKSGDKFEH